MTVGSGSGEPPVYRGLRAALRSLPFLTCSLLTIPDPAVAALLGCNGCDYVLVDAEHGPFSLDSIRNCLEAIARTGAWSVVRVSSNDPALIKQVLELGPDGIQIPLVDKASEAAAAVRAVRYPPEGVRGLGTGRAQWYGMKGASDPGEVNASIAALVMIESRLGVSNAGEIARTVGLDGIVVGSLDLAMDLGVGLATRHPQTLESIYEVVGAARNNGVAVGTACVPSEISKFYADGMNLFVAYSDFGGLISSGNDSFGEISELRKDIGRVWPARSPS
jgi:4-hydroxy-2-oxoheptanedioate aldolase